MTRDWTEAEARAWLRVSLPKGWIPAAHRNLPVMPSNSAVVCAAVYGFQSITFNARTLRSACRALIRAAKRAGIAVNQVQEPGGKS